MTHAAWPIFDLRITVADLLLRPFREADLDEIARILPADVELNPKATRYRGGVDGIERATIIHQDYWRAMGSWTPDEWRLNFAVVQGEQLIGAQELEGHDFARLRTVDTASFLVTEKRGLGLGKAMRRGVLALAFEHLRAEHAITSAWHDNTASLGVSRSLGYADNGWSRLRRDDGADELAHLRLTRAEWSSSGLADGIVVTGAQDCLPYFGLP